MIIDATNHKGLTTYVVSKSAHSSSHTLLDRSKIDFIIDHDADVFTDDGKLLLRFRKNRLPKAAVKDFYSNVIDFAKKGSTNRGSASASIKRTVKTNPKVMTNIIGYIDTLSPQQKFRIKQKGIKLDTTVRPTRFNVYHPEKYIKLLPLIKKIDTSYKRLIPTHYRKQRAKADETLFRIPGTAFTTITTNVNFQTAVHQDKGDDDEGFGNLTVIQHGKYAGGETCFPEYKVGVDVRTGDMLFMDVHQWHGNLPIIKQTEDAVRLSVVCYLRKGVWQKTKHMKEVQVREHIKKIVSIRSLPEPKTSVQQKSRAS